MGFTILYNNSKKIIAVIALLVMYTLSLKAQKPDEHAKGKISGRIIDSASAQPIDYATISLLIQENDKVVNGTTTDEKGVFKLTNVAADTYKMLIYFIGYKTA